LDFTRCTRLIPTGTLRGGTAWQVLKNRYPFLQTNNDTRQINTTTKTDQMSASAIGNGILPANFARVGTTIKITTHGLNSFAAGGVNAIFDIDLGAVNLISSNLTLPTTGGTDVTVNSEIYIKFTAIGITGTVKVTGHSEIHSTNGIVSRSLQNLTGVTVNTTIDNLIKMWYTWGGVGDLRIANYSIEVTF
jgi:hypothetical protein